MVLILQAGSRDEFFSSDTMVWASPSSIVCVFLDCHNSIIPSKKAKASASLAELGATIGHLR